MTVYCSCDGGVPFISLKVCLKPRTLVYYVSGNPYNYFHAVSVNKVKIIIGGIKRVFRVSYIITFRFIKPCYAVFVITAVLDIFRPDLIRGGLGGNAG